MKIKDFGIKGIREAGDLKGKRVVLRLDINVPVKEGIIEDDYRIVKSLPILKYLKEAGAVSLILSHIEKNPGNDTLLPVAKYLEKDFSISFIKDVLSLEAANKIKSSKPGDMILFENIRQYPEEQKNDEDFSKRIASLGDIYVNDAFATSHRSHASIVGIPKFLPHYAGLQLEQEIEHLSLGDNPPRPFLFILGGAKIESKLPLIEKFLKKADFCFVGGALANDFFKAKGMEVGVSLISSTSFDKSALSNPKLLLPPDVTVLKGEKRIIKKPEETEKDENILDVGPETVSLLKSLADKSKYILWNGPLGNYEKGFKEPTLQFAKILSESSAETVLGGGDTIAAIKELDLEDKFTFVSTGGGAMLEFLLNDTLPGLDALK